jgi:hypothetical protein
MKTCSLSQNSQTPPIKERITMIDGRRKENDNKRKMDFLFPGLESPRLFQSTSVARRRLNNVDHWVWPARHTPEILFWHVKYVPPFQARRMILFNFPE